MAWCDDPVLGRFLGTLYGTVINSYLAYFEVECLTTSILTALRQSLWLVAEKISPLDLN